MFQRVNDQGVIVYHQQAASYRYRLHLHVHERNNVHRRSQSGFCRSFALVPATLLDLLLHHLRYRILGMGQSPSLPAVDAPRKTILAMKHTSYELLSRSEALKLEEDAEV